MADEDFFKGRTEVEVGGGGGQDFVPERLQTDRPDRATQGRVVITIHCEVPRDRWGPLDTDAVDVLRREVETIEDVSAWFAKQNDLGNTDSFTVDIDVEATK